MKLEELVCPYSNCSQSFKRPVMVTDYSKLPRETYYACPHCMLRLELMIDGDSENEPEHLLVKSVEGEGLLSGPQFQNIEKLGEAVSNPQATRPSKQCRHFFGYLRTRPHDAEIPDECTVCPNIMQCYVSNER